MKNTHNAPIMLLEREIFNLNFDLDQLEKTKMTLPSDLSDFVSVNSVRVTDQGFEPAAKVDSRWM
jgi:4-diphosphocytidyl-2C-methyl-D-erythritol kinase